MHETYTLTVRVSAWRALCAQLCIACNDQKETGCLTIHYLQRISVWTRCCFLLFRRAHLCFTFSLSPPLLFVSFGFQLIHQKIVDFNSSDRVFFIRVSFGALLRHFEHFSWLWENLGRFVMILCCWINKAKQNTKNVFHGVREFLVCRVVLGFRKIDSYWHRCWKIC